MNIKFLENSLFSIYYSLVLNNTDRFNLLKHATFSKQFALLLKTFKFIILNRIYLPIAVNVGGSKREKALFVHDIKTLLYKYKIYIYIYYIKKINI